MLSRLLVCCFGIALSHLDPSEATPNDGVCMLYASQLCLNISAFDVVIQEMHHPKPHAGRFCHSYVHAAWGALCPKFLLGSNAKQLGQTGAQPRTSSSCLWTKPGVASSSPSGSAVLASGARRLSDSAPTACTRRAEESWIQGNCQG